jgi:two-component system, cell cycle sensor histidine kinase and response regulator CckA
MTLTQELAIAAAGPERAVTAKIAKTILVVEDERIVARDIQRSLVDLGYQVPATAASADQAIRLASERCPDLVLMDIRIKGERDGIEAATILRQRFDVPIVYLTAYADEPTVERAKLTQPFGYLMKPVKAYELRSAVEIALFKHEMDKQLRDRERWLATTMRSIGDAIISTDTAGRINYMNPVAEALTGWKAEQAHGHMSEEVLRLVRNDRGRTPMANPLQVVLDEGRPVNVDGVLVRAPGNDRFISDNTSPIVGDGGSLLGAVMVFRDVGEQRRLQRQLEQADRLASVGTMAAGVAHEVNNPLTYILTNISFVLEEIRRRIGQPGTPDSRVWMKELEGALADAEEGTKRIGKIVTDLKTFTRPLAETQETANLNEVLDWSLRVAGHELMSRGRIVRRFGEVPPVDGSAARLGQVFVNLIINAIHSLDPARRDTNEIVLTTRTDAEGRAVAEVRDTGCGMTEGVMDRAFDAFFTTKAAVGTGLGLSVSHGIIESFGGKILFESEPGVGTVARVVLPAGRQAPFEAPWAQQPAASAAMPCPVPHGYLLVVIDEPLERSAMRRMLGSQHAVTCPKTAAQALALVAGGMRFDLILCDLKEPGRAGQALYEAVRVRDPEQARRVVFLTDGRSARELVDFLASVPNRHIEMPSDVQQLRGLVIDLLVELGPVAGRTSAVDAPESAAPS